MLCGSFAERVRSGDISFLRDRPVAQLHEDQIPMAHLPQIRIPATYMRGGTSKGVFFRLQDLPQSCQVPGAARDKLFMRVIGSPDPYSAHIDGMGGATSSTSKCVILSKSSRPDHDVEYLYGQVSIDKPFVDWSGNCGNLSTGAGAFALHAGLVDASRIPDNGTCVVRIWQANIGKTIIAHVPVANGQVQETGDFELDGVTFPAAEIVLEFLDPSDDGEEGGSMFPTGNLVDELEVPGIGTLKATMISAGIPTVFVNAEDIGYQGTELREDINGNPDALARLESIRVAGALRMGLIKTAEEALTRQHTPKVAFVSRPKSYRASSGKTIEAGEVDLLVRALSMGKLHHAMMGTCAVAIGTAAAVPGTLVNLAAGGGERQAVRFGHPSGTLRVGAEAKQIDGQWTVTKAIMSRSARVLMEGWVRVPGDAF
ncbi:3-methylitaconate isomerase [Stutzerimonas stutzeri]|nr:3-methylitaconate isomerase [Stutzerimonas stutzeri]CAB5586375.1 3-methylitaconate isomerase [Stutzerimonas stutzeri]CAC9103297.1 3-methylitaconate isomerase [Stutzerimonas stutzeri]